MRRRRFLAAAAAPLPLLAAAACSGGAARNERPSIVFGTARWPAETSLGPDATLVVYLVDASAPEPPLEVALQKLDDPEPGAELLAYATDRGGLRSPQAFALPVPAGKVDPARDYALRVAVVDQGRPVLAAADAPLVLTRGRPRQVDVALEPVVVVR